MALVRGAMFTCFFGSTFAYVFFVVVDLREMGETLAVFRSTALLAVPFERVVVVVAVVEDGNESNFVVLLQIVLLLLLLLLVLVDVVVVPFVAGIADASTKIRGSSFCCSELLFATPDGRTTIFVRSFRRLGRAFICVLKNPVIFVCERILFGALPLLIL